MKEYKQRNMTATLMIILLGLYTTSAIKNLTKSEESTRSRANRALGIFSVIQFPNTACLGSGGLNGTCYTNEECETKGGAAAGVCASSFGVCCIFSLGCGTTTTENSTYHTVTSYNTNSDPSPCIYTICPCTSEVCKLRIDMETFSISGPFTVVSMIVEANLVTGGGPKTGDCITDSFMVTNPGGQSPPVICGLNTGQHIYVDSSPDCNVLTFNIDQANSIARAWNIKVTQLDCTNEFTDHDCLQYLTGVSGTFSSFNFDTTATTVTGSSTMHHLNDQMYNICFRREEGYCGVCFSPGVSGTAFGVSVSKAAAAQSANELTCTGVPGDPNADFISVEGLHPPAVISSSLVNTPATTIAEKICGQIFAVEEAKTAGETACTYRVPFKWGVHLDDQEQLVADGPADHSAGENNGGTIGFYMDYWQQSCS